MKRILKTIYNYGFFFLLIFAINSCAHFKIKKLDKETLIPNDFYSFLSKEYLNFAKFELYEMHDEIDANYFAFKASQLIILKIQKIGTYLKIMLEKQILYSISLLT